LKDLESQLSGLSVAEADERVKCYGLNQIAREKRLSPLMRLLDNVKNPLVILLTSLGILSYLTGDLRAMIVIFAMVLLGIVLRFFQELRADNAAEKLKAMVNTTVTVLRDGQDTELALKFLVPGDIIRVAAGDMVPADARVDRKGFVPEPGGAHWRIPANREESRPRLPRSSKSAGTAGYLLPRFERRKRQRHSRRHPYW
jgi:Mg2+-importing ATPase